MPIDTNHHAQLPWYVRESAQTAQLYISSGPFNVGVVYNTSLGQKMPLWANAHLIVEAVNHHYQLLAVLDAAKAALRIRDDQRMNELKRAIDAAEEDA